MALTVGVDVGGTSTAVAFGRGGELAGTARSGPANPTTYGVAGAAATIAAAITDALEQSVSAEEAPSAIFVGAAGAGRPNVAAALESSLRARFPQSAIAVSDDALIALRAAIAAGPGIVLVAGTGSIALADDGNELFRCGGLGPILGDEGSGYAIGLAALKLLGRVLDGRASADELTDHVARELKIDSRAALLEVTYAPRIEPAAVAALAPPIVALAGNGNRAAAKIVQGAAADLAELIKAVARRAKLVESGVRVALAGGLLRENSLLSYLLEMRVGADLPGCGIVRAGDEPVIGALRLAQALLK